MGESIQKTILLVEDEVILAMNERMRLENYGYKVVMANSGEKAVEIFRSGDTSIDLVLMDINLGKGMDGTEAAQLILDDHDLPIVFLSSHTEPEVVEKTEKITSYGYVVKSSSITVLDASIKMAFKLFEANRKIKESESQYHALVDGMPGIVYTFSSKRGGLFYSSATQEILGYSPERLLADPMLWQKSIHPEDVSRVRRVISDSGSGEPFQVSYRIRDSRGEWHWFEDRSIGARASKDEVVIDGLALDLTSLRRAEEAIDAGDVRLRKLFANIPDLVFQFTRRPDGSYHVPIASPGIRSIFGCSPEDVLMDFEPIGRVIHPEDADRVIADIEYSAQHLSYFTCEFRVILPGKGVQWIYSRSSPERMPDGSVTWHGFNANITEKKLKEQEVARTTAILRATMESPKDMVIMTIDRDYRYVNYNTAHREAMRAAYGTEPAIGADILERISSAEDRARAKANYDKALRGESHSTMEEYGNLKKTFFESHFNPIFDEKGEVIGITAFARDITESKRMELELRETNQYLQNLFDYANAPIIVWDPDLRISRFNRAFEQLTGRSADEVLGQPLEILFPQARVHDSMALINLTKAGEHWDVVEIDIQHVDGSIRTLLWNSATLFTAEGSRIVATIAQGQDITDRKRAEAELRASYDMLRLYIKDSPIYSFIKEVEPGRSRVIAASENYVDMTGVPGSKMAGMTMHELFPSEFAEKMSADDWSVASGEATLRLDEVFKDRYYTTIKFPIKVGEKRLLGGYTIDVTNSRLTEEALRESQKVFRSVFETARDGFWIIDESGSIKDASEAFCRHFGYSKEELLSMSIMDISVDESAQAVAEHLARIRSKGFEVFEARYRHKSGRFMEVESSVTWLGSELRRFVSSCRDITERKKSEDALKGALWRMQAIIDGTNAGTWEWNVQTGELAVNERWAEITGHALKELEPTSIKTWEMLCHPEHLRESVKLLERHFSGELPYYECEYRMRHKDGSWIWVIDRGRVMTWTLDGKPLMMFGTHSDISERKKAQERLESALLENKNLLRELQHRAKNSFSIIAGMVTMASGEAASPETRDALEYLGARIGSISELYSLLSFDGSVAVLRLDEYCARVVRPLAATAGNISLEMDLERIKVPAGEAAPIGLILTELVTNAVKYAFPEGRRGTVRIALRKMAEGMATLEAVDDGIGIPEGFEPPRDAGIGLKLVQGLAEQIGGSFAIMRGRVGTRSVLSFKLAAE